MMFDDTTVTQLKCYFEHGFGLILDKFSILFEDVLSTPGIVINWELIDQTPQFFEMNQISIPFQQFFQLSLIHRKKFLLSI